MTLPTSAANASATITRATTATTTGSCFNRPIRASGNSNQVNQCNSRRGSSTKSRNSTSRNTPPKAAICGWAACRTFA